MKFNIRRKEAPRTSLDDSCSYHVPRLLAGRHPDQLQPLSFQPSQFLRSKIPVSAGDDIRAPDKLPAVLNYLPRSFPRRTPS